LALCIEVPAVLASWLLLSPTSTRGISFRNENKISRSRFKKDKQIYEAYQKVKKYQLEDKQRNFLP
jgi:hypothetical protein